MVSDSSRSIALVIGAGGGLGTALCRRWCRDDAIDRVIAVSRQPAGELSELAGPSHLHIQSDYSEASIADVCDAIAAQDGHVSRVCICNGLLHSDRVWPEKRIEELEPAALQEVFFVNCVVPALWLKALLPLVKGRQPCVVAVFSARVGSIGDNRYGGWYSYRASKAALNMVLKTASIEFARRAKNVKLIAFQPGTTDTDLSKPFQASVPSDNLLQPDYVAGELAALMNRQTIDGDLSFVDWRNQPIVW